MSQLVGSAPLRLVAYADETRYNVGRFRAIAVISLREADADKSKDTLRALLAQSNVRELKWKLLDGAKERFAAHKVFGFILDKASRGQIRADVLIWDTRDRRHVVRRRDDIANLQRMYYHVFKNVLRERWPDGSVWNLFPDEHTSLEWASVEDFLHRASMQTEIEQNLLTKGSFRIRLRKEFQIEEIIPSKSCDEQFVQTADLFAGLGAYSWEKFSAYEQWQQETSPQQQLFPATVQSAHKLSRSDHERCQLLAVFDRECKQRKLGVSLETHRGLKTYDPKNPINFWLYFPQHEEDKAPVKSSR